MLNPVLSSRLRVRQAQHNVDTNSKIVKSTSYSDGVTVLGWIERRTPGAIMMSWGIELQEPALAVFPCRMDLRVGDLIEDGRRVWAVRAVRELPVLGMTEAVVEAVQYADTSY